jgi:hypothetical protein
VALAGFQDQLAVNLVGTNHDVILFANCGQIRQLISVEHSSHGIVGVTENVEPGIGCNRFLDAVEIHLPVSGGPVTACIGFIGCVPALAG